MSQKRAPILFNKPLRYLSSRGARKMENIADETVHVFNANDDITLHPSKDVNHAAGNANELRLRLQVQVMEIHYTSTLLPAIITPTLSHSPSGIAMFASLRFINFVRTNWREKEGRNSFSGPHHFPGLTLLLLHLSSICFPRWSGGKKRNSQSISPLSAAVV